jgi:hypothetical protein
MPKTITLSNEVFEGINRIIKSTKIRHFSIPTPAGIFISRDQIQGIIIAPEYINDIKNARMDNIQPKQIFRKYVTYGYHIYKYINIKNNEKENLDRLLDRCNFRIYGHKIIESRKGWYILPETYDIHGIIRLGEVLKKLNQHNIMRTNNIIMCDV